MGIGGEKRSVEGSGERLRFTGEGIGNPWVLEGGAERPGVEAGSKK